MHAVYYTRMDPKTTIAQMYIATDYRFIGNKNKNKLVGTVVYAKS